MKYCKILFSLIGASLICSCSTVSRKKNQPESPVLERFSEKSSGEAFACAAEFAAGFEKSLLSGDFASFKQVLPVSANGNKMQLDAVRFGRMRSSLLQIYGVPQKMEYVAMLDQGKLRDYLWKIKFMRPAEAPALPESREILFSIRVYQESGQTPAVAGFVFKRF